MKKLIILTLLLQGCSMQKMLLTSTEYKSIPINSKKIIVSVPYSSDSLFIKVSTQFAKDGCPLVINDKVIRQAICNGKSLSGSGAMIYMNALVEGNKVEYTASYGLNASGRISLQVWTGSDLDNSKEPAIFEQKPYMKADYCFQYMYLHAKNLGGQITFQ